ncbi:MAG: hypothetical protein HYZ50_23480 [Deltaproteobacteria bacterium]|nr:hypothetical protein [Deltaproteobacteria bacterium]
MTGAGGAGQGLIGTFMMKGTVANGVTVVVAPSSLQTLSAGVGPSPDAAPQ